MSLTHEYLKKYSYNRTKQPPIDQEAQIIVQLGQNELQVEKRLEESIKSEFHSVQQERIETEIQNQEFHQNQMIELNEVNQSNELNQSLLKTVKNTVSRKKQIFESVKIQSIQQPLISKKQEKAFVITEQYNININLHQSPKVDKSIQIHENSIAPILKSQPIQNQNLHPFSQANKEVSMYIDQSQSKEIEIDNNDKLIQPEFVESEQQIKVDFEEQNLQQSENVEEVQNEIIQESKEQPFLHNQEMDFDYNKEEYLKIIDDYIEFIKINEYIDAQQIEAQILNYQHMTSKKLYLLVIEPLIITMTFEVIPENPFKKNCQTMINKIDYADFYDILKNYRKALEYSDYIPGLSDFMHYQLSQQTQFFLQIKKQQIQWNKSLYDALQACRVEISQVLSMYEQLNKDDVYLLEADIDAFLQQLKQMNGNRIKIFKNLFYKYKKKTYFLLKYMKNNNFKIYLSRNHFDYENLKQTISLQLNHFQQEIDNCQRPISTQNILKLLQIFQNLKINVREAVEYEFNLRIHHIDFEPIQVSLLNEVLNIFQIKKTTKNRNHLKAKVILLQKKESFNWTLSLDVEKFELKRVKVRYQILQNFKQELIKQNEDPRLIKSLNSGEQSYLNNILMLTQYLAVKEMIKSQKIDLLSYPKSNYINEIKSQSFQFSELISETNQKIQAINQLNHYRFLEQLQDILSLEDYKKVSQQLQELKNILISNKFSQIIQNDLEILLKFLTLSLRFFPSDIEKVYIQSETYEEMELQLGDIKQFILLSEEDNNQLSVKLLQIFEEFFDKKVRKQFQQLLQSLINLSQKPLMLQNPLKVQKRIDLLYEYQKPDYQINKYVDQDLINQIEDEPNLREFFDLARGFFDHLVELVKEDNCLEDIDYANDKIISEIQQFEIPQNIDVNITNLAPLIQYHKDLQQYQSNNNQTLINAPIDLGIIVYQQYQSYLKACQDRVKLLQDCIELKINDIQAIEFILFRVHNQTELVPIYQLHTQIQCFYSDYQSIQIPRFLNKKERKIILNQCNRQERPQDIQIFVQSQNVHNVGIFIDDQLTIYCE